MIKPGTALRFILIFLLGACGVFNLPAQTGGGKKTDHAKADKVFEQHGYKTAIPLYREGELDAAAIERIATGYRLNHDTQNAEKWYAQLLELSSEPAVRFYYAQALQCNGKYDQAKKFYLEYDRQAGSSDKRGERLATAIDRMAELRHSSQIEVLNAANLNSPKLDFSPAFLENGIVFVSNRAIEKSASQNKDLWTGDDYAALYFAPLNKDGLAETPQPFGDGLSARFHRGPLTFSKSGEEVWFTGNSSKEGKKQEGKGKEFKLKIFTATKKGGNWGEPLPLDLGEPLANDCHPALSADGQRFYFTSDREGGYGGMDLYVSHFTGGKWSTPLNLGPTVNTPGNEVFPFSYDDGTLYFASDGWGGLGGLDIFYSDELEDGSMRQATNLGAPFNSNKDDFGYILDVTGTQGYFTSAREGGAGGDDIYTFSLPKPQSNKSTGKFYAVICVQDAATGERLAGARVTAAAAQEDGTYVGFEDDFVVKLVPTGQPQEFTLSLKRRDPFAAFPPETETYTTNENGTFRLQLREGKKYVFVARKDGYAEVTQEFSRQDMASGLDICIPLSGTNCLVLRGNVTNRQYGNPLPGATVTLIDLCTGELKTVKSDEDGKYSFPCLPCGCDFVIRGGKKFFKEDNNLVSTLDADCPGVAPLVKNLQLLPAPDAEGERVRVKTQGSNSISNSISNKGGEGDEFPTSYDAVMEAGVVIELENIYYDFNDHHVRLPDAAQDLDRVVSLLMRYPNLRAELASHTDSRGETDYNQALSQRRAEAAVRYIVAKGIDPARITAKGYGESNPVNECVDGTPCPETAHQLNRRTEIRLFE
jgi:outer membrane protein OmpA-like peptidoglycan-associated protein